MRLAGKTLVVIGGTTGLGLSASKAFTNVGANVVVVGRNKESGEDAIIQIGPKAIFYKGDASHEHTAKEAIELALDHFGDFHGIYHVAGGSGRKMGDGPLHELSLEGWEYTINLNLTSLMLSNRAAVKILLKSGHGGSILNMGSVLGFSPSPKYFVTHAYAAAKSAVIGFTKSIASYYAKDNIRINLLAPALVETPMSSRASYNNDIQAFIKTKQPLNGGRNGKPEDLDGAAVFFMSDESAFTTGQTLYIDGGWEVSEGQW